MSYLTRRLFGQILGGIEWLAGHPLITADGLRAMNSAWEIPTRPRGRRYAADNLWGRVDEQIDGTG